MERKRANTGNHVLFRTVLATLLAPACQWLRFFSTWAAMILTSSALVHGV